MSVDLAQYSTGRKFKDCGLVPNDSCIIVEL